MKNKCFRNCAYISVVLFLISAGLLAYAWLGSSNSSQGLPYISLGENVHISVTKRVGGGLVCFNQDTPYTGSIIKFAGDNTINETGFTGAGIYFRHITHAVEKDKNWWTLIISLWYPVIAFGILPLVFLIKKSQTTKEAAQQIHS
jgi:hypothetical protein